MAGAGHHIAEQAVHHAFLYAQVDDELFVAVVYAGEFGLLRLLLHDLDLVDDLGGDVFRSELRVVQEEGLAINGYLVDCLAVGGNGTIFGDFDAGKLLEELLQHVVVGGLEGGGVVFDSVFLHHDGVADVGDPGGIQQLGVGVHLDDAESNRVFLDLYLQAPGLVAEKLGLEGVFSGGDLIDAGLALVVGQGVFVGTLGAFLRKGYGCEGHGLLRRGVLEGQGYAAVLGRERQDQQQGCDAGEKPADSIVHKWKHTILSNSSADFRNHIIRHLHRRGV